MKQQKKLIRQYLATKIFFVFLQSVHFLCVQRYTDVIFMRKKIILHT